MPGPQKVTDEKFLASAIANDWSPRAIARELGLSWGRNVIDRMERLRGETPDFTVERPPPPEIPIDELVEQRIAAFRQKRQHEDARKLIPVTVRDSRPMGILHFGDPHVDDDGTDLELLRDHARLVRKTDGLWAATVGDATNNWIGRLAHLYGQQSTTASDAWRLAEWFFGEASKWLYVVGGNHDLWSGSGDPLKWIAAQIGALYQDSEARVALQFPNGLEVRINCRHDFNGHSQWNPAHGPMKAQLLGVRDHLAIAGHKHISAYGVLKDSATEITLHSIIVGSYKRFDRYAREKGFRDQALGPACLTVIDPSLPETHPDLLKAFWDPHEGADFLAWKRRKSAA